MTYDEALEFIHETRYRGGKDGVKHMRILAQRLGNPQEGIPMVHVGGTNGKGSVCTYIQAALRCAGYRVGLYTSPFLERFNERIRIDGRPIPDDVLARHTQRVAESVWQLRSEGILPTEFEIKTALAFSYFAEEKVDIAVMEVGLGGRCDSTNIITPRVSVITTIGLDHTKLLGSTLALIAGEKAGIAKPGVPLVLYPGAPEEVLESVKNACDQAQAPLIHAPAAKLRMLTQTASGCAFEFEDVNAKSWRIDLNMPGEHQAINAATALQALLVLRDQGWKLPEEAILDGMAKSRWPGRMEWVGKNPAVLLDGAHNPQGMETVAAFLAQHAQGKKIVALTGMLREKDVEGVVEILSKAVEAVVTVAPNGHRAVAAEDLARLYVARGVKALACGSMKAAYEQALLWAGEEGLVVIAGSLYLVGEMRTLLQVPQCHLLEGDA